MIAQTIVDCTKTAGANETVEGCSQSSITPCSRGYIYEPDHSRDGERHGTSAAFSTCVRRCVSEGVGSFEPGRRVIAEGAVRIDIDVAALSTGCRSRGSQTGVGSGVRIDVIDQKSVSRIWLDAHVAQNGVAVGPCDW